MKNKRNKLIKASNGITLIALVITIIVLLILAGVTIATLTGENGVLTKAKSAQTQTEQAKEDENLKIAIAGSYGTDGKLNLKDLKDNLTNQEILYTDSDAFPLEVTVNGGKIEIKQDGTIEEVFDAEEWDKTATPEDCFYWGSDNPSDKEYGTVGGYTAKIENYTKLRFPSRCTKIIFDDGFHDVLPINPFESRAFTNEILKIEIPNTVTFIGGTAFGHQGGDGLSHSFKKLQEIILSSNITTISYGAFEGCTNLSTITIPSSVINMENGVFTNCTSLKTINVQGHSSAPSGWDSNWNYGCSATINWNQ